MPEKILVPMDDSPQAEAALRYALEKFPDAETTALHVVQLPNGYWAAFVDSEAELPGYEAARDHARDLLEAAVRTAADYGSELDTAILTGDPPRKIVEYAVDHDFDQIVLGSHGRKGIDRILLGSVSETVVRRAPMTVVVVHER